MTQAIKKLTSEECEALVSSGKITVEGHELVTDDLRLIFEFAAAGEGSKYAAHSHNGLLVLLNVEPTQELRDEGFAREMINRVQRLRKKVKWKVRSARETFLTFVFLNMKFTSPHYVLHASKQQ